MALAEPNYRTEISLMGDLCKALMALSDFLSNKNRRKLHRNERTEEMERFAQPNDVEKRKKLTQKPEKEQQAIASIYNARYGNLFLFHLLWRTCGGGAIFGVSFSFPH